MIYFIPTPIGNLKDISLHALEILRDCEIALCEDTRVSKSLINLLNERFNADIKIKNFISLHTHNESEFFKNLDTDFFSKNVAYISDAGMPGISDPGVSLVRYALKNGIEYEILSGANAALLAVVASGLVDKEFIFLGFLPNTGKDRVLAIQNALNNAYPCVIYESPKRIISLIDEILKIDENRQIFAIKEATKKFEAKFKNTPKALLDELKNANLNGEWCVVVDKSQNLSTQKITIDEINQLEIPPKIKAKLLSKITGEDVKKIYNKIIK
ncbi:16S rRNA methyltransferase [Campylobacter mucosalis]|uniref:16S rRNA (cytidine(1402)-2'-O)-methyltransferase n=1 Tax=Campylobacter mucosalis TaxID=202 RepID=UPI0004D44BBF|nr:16S rRNA (cytidine(1402)-2'-O)-methyltransferase [Campylobacter mucosalis]KEA45758.1 16S rRNA methyltransferase [Campylobacter mucosalis]QKF62273.1 16S rRNA (cytidine(1402)-2'-O)-methyltransferase [Campylobacter mucosalis]